MTGMGSDLQRRKPRKCGNAFYSLVCVSQSFAADAEGAGVQGCEALAFCAKNEGLASRVEALPL
jgi:hypothetical protein